MRKEFSILVVVNYKMYRDALKAYLMFKGYRVVYEAATVKDAMSILMTHNIDVILLDTQLVDYIGDSTVQEMHKRRPGLQIATISDQYSLEEVKRYMGLGVVGFFSKKLPLTKLEKGVKLLEASSVYIPLEVISEKAIGTTSSKLLPEVTKREEHVLSLISKGLSNKEVANALSLSEMTVKSHVSSILRKLEVSNRVYAVNFYKERESQLALNSRHYST